MHIADGLEPNGCKLNLMFAGSCEQRHVDANVPTFDEN